MMLLPAAIGSGASVLIRSSRNWLLPTTVVKVAALNTVASKFEVARICTTACCPFPAPFPSVIRSW
ncbi:MAG: hypothetical protein DMF50_01740 [Acidobacteria bacterium]|nr:MAG: hypothetical protein DMF50_01740 [Acidobacteriota bacterium]